MISKTTVDPFLTLSRLKPIFQTADSSSRRYFFFLKKNVPFCFFFYHSVMRDILLKKKKNCIAGQVFFFFFFGGPNQHAVNKLSFCREECIRAARRPQVEHLH